MMEKPKFIFDLVVSLHPDGEQELTTYGNLDINLPLLQSFLALNNIYSRKVSFRLYVPVKTSPKPVPNWDSLKPRLQEVLTLFARQADQQLQFSVQQIMASSNYDHDMHFVFAQDKDFLYLITPATVDMDLYGTDHGMYEHEIIKVPDLFQADLIERILVKWDIVYEKLHHLPVDGFRVHEKQANLWAYGGMEGLREKFQAEISRLFANYSSIQGTSTGNAKVTFSLVDSLESGV